VHHFTLIEKGEYKCRSSNKQYMTTVNVVWENVTKDVYLRSALGDENRITVIWAPGLFGDTESRRCVISSAAQWHAISLNDSFVP
jgi:hypothetical protein